MSSSHSNDTLSIPHHGGGDTHLDHLRNESISQLAPFSSLILTIIAVIVFFIRQYLFERWLMNTKLYKAKYEALAEDQRRSFLNHHVAGLVKVVLLFSAAYPFFAVTFGNANPHTPIIGHGHVSHGGHIVITMGDVMMVCSNIFTVMYIFELYYRKNVSYISAAHHIGAITIAQTAIALSLNYTSTPFAIYEFVMCFVWGAFDVLAEIWPHLAMIYYRLKPDDHLFLSRMFMGTAILEICGTTLETIVVFYLFGSLWSKWDLTFKILTPILHVLFSCAQLWGAFVFRQLSQGQYRKWKAQQGRLMENGDLNIEEKDDRKLSNATKDNIGVFVMEDDASSDHHGASDGKLLFKTV